MTTHEDLGREKKFSRCAIEQETLVGVRPCFGSTSGSDESEAVAALWKFLFVTKCDEYLSEAFL